MERTRFFGRCCVDVAWRYLREKPCSKIVFLAPNQPLVEQQATVPIEVPSTSGFNTARGAASKLLTLCAGCEQL
eukprot:1363900-Amphidinium_carterae.1